MKTAITLAATLLLVGCGDGDRCFAKARELLKDPQTATLTKWYEDYGEVKVEMRASNGFGAFGKVYATCRADTVVIARDHSEWITGR